MKGFTLRRLARRALPLVILVPALAARAAPDLVVHNGRIVTADAGFSTHPAMAVEDGKVVALGADAEILAARGPGTTVVDLRGRTVMPGLIDSTSTPPPP